MNKGLFVISFARPTRIISECTGLGESRGCGKDHPLATIHTMLTVLHLTLIALIHIIRNIVHKCGQPDGLKGGHNDSTLQYCKQMLRVTSKYTNNVEIDDKRSFYTVITYYV